MFDEAPFIVESFVRMLFAGGVPAICVPDTSCVWLGVNVKLRILLFIPAELFGVFALLIESLGRPIGFIFLFFGASGTSSNSCDALDNRMLSSCEAPVWRAGSVGCAWKDFCKYYD